jgi:drug/metabolite transporter (DMT)-like permease
MLNTRALSRSMHPIAMQFHTSVFGAVLVILILAFTQNSGVSDLMVAWPSPRFLGYLIGVGVAASVSHLLMSYALRFAPSTFLAPLHYLEIVSAVIFGFAIFGDIPSTLAMWGMVLVVGSGLFVIWRERQIAAQKI